MMVDKHITALTVSQEDTPTNLPGVKQHGIKRPSSPINPDDSPIKRIRDQIVRISLKIRLILEVKFGGDLYIF